MTREEFYKKFNELEKLKFWQKNICGYIFVNRTFLKNFPEISRNALDLEVNKENFLYKYSPADDCYSIKNLKYSKLFFKYAINFEDKYDSALHFSEKWKEKVKADKNLLCQIKNTISNFREECMVTCFTETNLNARMWDQYASQHRGFCQEYSLDELQKEYIKNSIVNNDNHIENICPVIYKENIFDADKFFPIEYLNGILENNLNYRIVLQPLLFFGTLTKLEEFSFENEWRWFKLFTHDLPDKRGFEKVGGNLGMLREVIPPKAVYLGKRMEEKNKKEIIEICKTKKIKVYQMVEENGILKPSPIEI